jgi:hypothetical protein
VLLAGAAAACDPGVPTESELGQLAGGGDRSETQLDARIVGGWSRTLFFDLPDGRIVVNETRFDFRANGRFTRLQITSDFGSGLGDQVASQGTWTTRDGTLTLTYETPAFRTDELPYRLESSIDGTRLFLDGLLFVQTATGL